MATRTRKMYVDVVNRKTYSGYNSFITTPIQDFFLDDEEILQIIPVQPNPDSNSSQKFVPTVTSGSYYAAAGKLGLFATGGQWAVTDPVSATTISAIDALVTASALQALFRTITTYAACIVTQDATGIYTVDRVTVGVVANPLTGDGTDLFPDSFVNINVERIGTTEVSQVLRISLDQKPAAYVEGTVGSGWTVLPSAAVTVATLVTGSGVQNAIFQVSINPDAYQGIFILTAANLGTGNATTASSQPIDFDSSDVDMQAQIIAGWGAGNEVTVQQINTYTWNVQFTGANILLKNLAAPTGNASGLVVPVGIQGNLDFRTNAAYAQLAGQSSTSVTFQIKNIDSDGVPQTWFFSPCTFNSTLISPATLGSSTIAFPLTTITGDARYLKLTGSNSPMMGVIDMGSHKITNLTDPTLAQDVASKNYVDTTVASVLTGGWLLKSANYTAASGQKILGDTSTAGFTITMPSAPTVGDEIPLKDAKISWTAHPLIINPNGLKINGISGNYFLNVDGMDPIAVYVSTAYGWRI